MTPHLNNYKIYRLFKYVIMPLQIIMTVIILTNF